MESSMLFPKIQRKSMLPPRWSRLPCRNMEVKIVTQVGAWSGASPVTPDWPSQATVPLGVMSHSSPGCVTS
jgi:hypothetical protein